MKKLISIFFAVILTIMCPVSAFAADYTVNPFYAIKSIDEYMSVKDTIKDKPTVYFGWSRITKDSNGDMVFTVDRNKISSYDLYNEYSIPEPLDGKLTQQMRKEQYPGGKNLLMVFLSKAQYEDGSINMVDLLNMGVPAWNEKIISPMMETVDAYGFDGVVLDIEGIMDSYTSTHYNTSQNSGMKEKYNGFLNEVKKAMSRKALVVCTNTPLFNGYDYSHIYNTADQIILLSYSYEHFSKYQESDGVPELVGQIKSVDIPEAQPYSKIKYDVDTIINQLKQFNSSSFNPKKILLGITLQVNGWMEKELTIQSKVYKYYEKANSLEKGNALNISSLEGIENMNSTGIYIKESPDYYYVSDTYKKILEPDPQTGIKKVEYYYDTPETISEKYYTIVHNYDLAGISVWRLGIGNTKTWNSIYSLFTNPESGTK